MIFKSNYFIQLKHPHDLDEETITLDKLDLVAFT